MYEKTAFNALVLLKENLSRAINDELDSLEKILYLESLTEQQVNKITQSIEDKEKRVSRTNIIICSRRFVSWVAPSQVRGSNAKKPHFLSFILHPYI